MLTVTSRPGLTTASAFVAGARPWLEANEDGRALLSMPRYGQAIGPAMTVPWRGLRQPAARSPATALLHPTATPRGSCVAERGAVEGPLLAAVAAWSCPHPATVSAITVRAASRGTTHRLTMTLPMG